MPVGSSQQSEDQFLCAICLDVFTDPVTTPCGHNFCKNCINQFWDQDTRYLCPVCEQMFNPKPNLLVNTLISDLAEEFRRSAGNNIQKQNGADPKSSPRGATVVMALVCLFAFVYMQNTYLLRGEEGGIKSEAEKVTDVETGQSSKHIHSETEEINLSVPPSKEEAERWLIKMEEAFRTLRESIKNDQAGLIEKIKSRQRSPEEQAEGFMEELEGLIHELKKVGIEVEVPSAALLEEIPKPLSGPELKEAQTYTVDMTFDPDTAHPWLNVFGNGKQVRIDDAFNKPPDTPKRFSFCVNVLAKQGFSSGRFYFEVLVKGKTDWTLGVAKESIDREGEEPLTPQNGYWTIRLRNRNKYLGLSDLSEHLALESRPEKVGVFVDYEEGLVSFYNVDDALHMYSFTGCAFTEKLFPFFSPSSAKGGVNSAPLIINPVL